MKKYYDKQENYLYSHMPRVGSAFLTLDENILESEHEFSQKFDENIASLINSEQVKKSNTNNRIKFHYSRAAAAVLALFIVAGGIGMTVNAATGGNLITIIREICFGKTDGATSQFYYGTTTLNDTLTIDDFPDGTVLTEVVYQGEGSYALIDGTEVSVNRIVFVNASETANVGDVLTVYVLPE